MLSQPAANRSDDTLCLEAVVGRARCRCRGCQSRVGSMHVRIVAAGLGLYLAFTIVLMAVQ